MVTRRTLLAAPLAACAGARGDMPPEGHALLSHSIMLSGADAEGRHFAAVRTCTYPGARVAWVWCMLLTPDGFWQYAANDAPWAPGGPDHVHVVAASGATVRTERSGAGDGLTGAFAADFRSQPALGEADAPVARGRVIMGAQFAPAAGHAGLLPGRAERFGRARFLCEVGGRAVSFEGPAQFHEQSQTEPRFTTPFAFASLWSDDLFATFLETPEASGGYVIERGAVRQVRAVWARLAPPEALTIEERDGAAIEALLEAVRRYRVPIHGEAWRGRFVRGRFAGRTVVGYLNSWRR